MCKSSVCATPVFPFKKKNHLGSTSKKTSKTSLLLTLQGIRHNKISTDLQDAFQECQVKTTECHTGAFVLWRYASKINTSCISGHKNITGNKRAHQVARAKVTTTQTHYTALSPAMAQDLLRSGETSMTPMEMDSAEVRARAKLYRSSSLQYLNNPDETYRKPPHSFSQKEQVIVCQCAGRRTKDAVLTANIILQRTKSRKLHHLRHISDGSTHHLDVPHLPESPGTDSTFSGATQAPNVPRMGGPHWLHATQGRGDATYICRLRSPS